MNSVLLSNGLNYPLIGLGTYNLDPSKIENTISSALELGYRKFDCAWVYHNEELIGKALSNSNIDRDKIWLTTKLHIKDITFGSYNHGLYFPKKSIRKAFEQACKRLKTDYIDTYMLHWPWKGYLNMWEELVKLYKEGLIKSIGMTGALPYHFQEIEKRFDILPMVNQVEFHPYNCDVSLHEYCKSQRCILESFSSFGSGPSNTGIRKKLTQDPVLIELSYKYRKSSDQVILRWLTQRGISVIPRSENSSHQKENIESFDFTLESSEIENINKLNRNLYVWADPHATIMK